MINRRNGSQQRLKKWLVCMMGLNLVLLALVAVLGISAIRLRNQVERLKQEAAHSSESGKETTPQPTGENIQTAPDEETIQTVPDEETAETKKQNYIVCVDAGHGGMHGATSTLDGRYESDDNLRLALAVQRELSAYEDVTIVMTRTEDVDVDNGVRAEIANEAGADLFVSIHRNSNSSGEKFGVEGWIHSSDPEDSRAAGEMILAELEEVGVTANLGVKSGTWDEPDVNYKIIRLAEMPAVLLEVGYLNYAEDNELFDANLDGYAKAIAEGIYAWLTEWID